ncbi:MAG TPA: pentapeptide repeat-containing protein [Ktedonobacterales bacterium]
MSGQSGAPGRPTDGANADAWRNYWTALGASWRRAPEIPISRQEELARQRATVPDIAQGIFPFKDVRLTRGDVEWLLATHESGGVTGPVKPEDAYARAGLDLRGAQLPGEDLSELPLTALRGGLTGGEQEEFGRQQRYDAAIHLEGAQLQFAHLERATLARAWLTRANLADAWLMDADLGGAHLEGALLKRADLSGAYLRGAAFDERSNLNYMRLMGPTWGAARMADIRWSGTNLAVINWEHVTRLGDEARALGAAHESRPIRLRRYNAAVRAYRQLATVLRSQGLNEDADRYAYRAQKLQATVLRLKRQWLRWLGSKLLDLVAGYGYHPLRSVLTYGLVIGSFAAVYFALGHVTTPTLSPLDALVFSVTSFHGRGFSPGASVTLHSPLTLFAAAEAICGLLIEIIFIATFTQRFFAH